MRQGEGGLSRPRPQSPPLTTWRSASSVAAMWCKVFSDLVAWLWFYAHDFWCRTQGSVTASLRFQYKLEEGNYRCEKLWKMPEICRKRSVYGDVYLLISPRSLTFSSGKLANIADGSVVVQASLDFEVGTSLSMWTSCPSVGMFVSSGENNINLL